MRKLFLLDDSIVFLNHGSFGACPADVFALYQDKQREMARNPVEFLGRRSAELLFESRRALGDFVGAPPEELIYVANATTGVNIVAHSLGLAPGDEILTSNHEYGACDNAWDFLAAKAGATIVRAQIPLPFRASDFVENLWAHVTPRTRMISLSHITSTTALIFPINEVCRRARADGILTLIDGAHAPGQIDLDLRAIGADFYSANCHKWLCSPVNVGFLHARDEHHAMLVAPTISWGYGESITGYAGFEAYTGTTLLERRLQWLGTRDITACLCVPAAIQFQKDHDWVTVRRRCHALAEKTFLHVAQSTGLPRLFEPRDFAQMVALSVPPMDPETLRATLFERYRIEVPVTTHGPHLFVRASVQGYNTEDDLAALEEALSEIFGLSG